MAIIRLRSTVIIYTIIFIAVVQTKFILWVLQCALGTYRGVSTVKGRQVLYHVSYNECYGVLLEGLAVVQPFIPR